MGKDTKVKWIRLRDHFLYAMTKNNSESNYIKEITNSIESSITVVYITLPSLPRHQMNIHIVHRTSCVSVNWMSLLYHRHQSPKSIHPHQILFELHEEEVYVGNKLEIDYN